MIDRSCMYYFFKSILSHVKQFRNLTSRMKSLSRIPGTTPGSFMRLHVKLRAHKNHNCDIGIVCMKP
jgi:hypothetical protein